MKTTVHTGSFSRMALCLFAACYLFFSVVDDAVVSQDSHWSNFFLSESISDEFPEDATPLHSGIVKGHGHRAAQRTLDYELALKPLYMADPQQVLPLRSNRPPIPIPDLPVMICVFRI